MSTRRAFLLRCGSAVGAAVLLGPAELFGSPVHLEERSLDGISFPEFSACLGTRFQIALASTPGASLELIRATPRHPGKAHRLHPAAADADNEKFSLVFRGSLAEPLDQGIHGLQHQAMGRFALFLVPVVSRDSAHRYYEAVFNRPRRFLMTGLPQAV